MFDDVRSLQAAVPELQANCNDPEAKLKVEQQRMNVLQVLTKNATRTAASALADVAAASTRSLLIERDLQQLEDELLKKNVILQEIVQSLQRDSSCQQQQFQSPPQHPHAQPPHPPPSLSYSRQPLQPSTTTRVSTTSTPTSPGSIDDCSCSSIRDIGPRSRALTQIRSTICRQTMIRKILKVERRCEGSIHLF